MGSAGNAVVEQAAQARWRQRTLLATAAWTGCGVTLFILAPLSAPILLPACTLAPLAWRRPRALEVAAAWPSSAIMALAIAVLYLVVVAGWSPSAPDAYLVVLSLLVLAVSLHVTLTALSQIGVAPIRAMSVGLVIGVAASGAIIFCEVFTHQWIRRLLASVAPGAFFDRQHMIMTDGWVTFAAPYLLNRSVAALTMLFWPAALACVRLGLRRSPLLLAPAAIAIFGSVHITSMVAFAGAALVLGLSFLAPACMRTAMTAAWIAAVLLVVPLAGMGYSGKLYLTDWLFNTAKQRIVIWGYTSSLISQAPIGGAGLHAARILHEKHRKDAAHAPGTDYRLTTGHHTHNIYLQAWYETGATGACLLMAIGLLTLRALARSAKDCRSHLNAAFACCAIMGASSFGLWQPWFLASLALAAVFASLAASPKFAIMAAKLA